jgi:hypothetical protein
MGIYCHACKKLNKIKTVPSKCPNCGQTDRTQFIRADDEDFDPGVIAKVKKEMGIL